MSFTPTTAVLDSISIPEAVFESFAAKQEDAFTYIGEPTLKTVKRYEQTIKARNSPVYPVVFFIDDEDDQTINDDTITGTYSFTFGIAITGRDSETLTATLRKYAKAYELMAVNTAVETASGALVAAPDRCRRKIQELRENKAGNEFYQECQITMDYLMYGSSHL